MARSPEAPRRRPSRIYAGIELSQPVNLAVPVALCFVVFAVWRVRCLYWGIFVSSGPRWNADGSFETSSGELDKAELESALGWLIVGALACLLGITLRWWRGRREWGDVPLGYGFGLSGLVYLIASWPSFDETGVLSLMDMHLAFPAALTLMVLLGILSYMSLELFTRRWREQRWLLAGLAAIVLFIPWIALRYGERLLESDRFELPDGTRLELELPRVRHPNDQPYGPLGADCGTPVYVQRGDELWLARGACDAERGQLQDWTRLEPAPSSIAEHEAQADALSSIRFGLNRQDWPVVSVALSRGAEVSDLAKVARDAAERFPHALGLYVIGSTVGQKARGTMLPGSSPSDRWSLSNLLRLDVEPREPFLVLDVLEPSAVMTAIEEWRHESPNPRYERGREPNIQIRLRVGDEVTLEELGAFYSQSLAFRGVSVFIE